MPWGMDTCAARLFKSMFGKIQRSGQRKIERLFAWLGNFRRLVVRYERYALNYLGFVQLGCILILLRQGL